MASIRLPVLVLFSLFLPMLLHADSPAPARLDLSIDTPEAGAVIGDPLGTAFVAGRAIAHFGMLHTFDVVLVVDQSRSTADPAGVDANGDGRIDAQVCPGLPPLLAAVPALLGACRGSRDSVLAVELSAVRTLLHQFDPRTTRVGLVSFSGDRRRRVPDASVVTPLTTEYTQVRQGLADIESAGPSGQTNLKAAIDTATGELMGAPGSFSSRRDAERIMLLLTDGVPTLPFNGWSANCRTTLEAALRAARADIRIDTYGIGREALSNPVVLVESARLSHGIFTPILAPRELQSAFEKVNFSQVDELEVRNRTNNRVATDTWRRADGSYYALLDMEEGTNTIDVRARSTDGAEERATVTVQFSRAGAPQRLASDLLGSRNRLMANRLARLRERTIAVEAERDERLRRELSLGIENRRDPSNARSRELEIRVRSGPDGVSTPSTQGNASIPPD